MDRNAEFANSSEGVREPQFHTAQQIKPPGYQRTSTLDQLLPSDNGLGPQDYRRLAFLGQDHSPLGQSNDTFESSVWLRQQRPRALYDLSGS